MILIRNAAYVVVSADEVLYDRDILIQDNKIARIGKNIPPDGCYVIEAAGKAVAPGFVNAHTHLYQNMLKGMNDTLRLKQWCEAVTFPFSNIIHKYERQLGDETLGYAYGMLGAIEMIRSGVTSFIDMDTIMDSVMEAWRDVKIRGIAAIQSVNRWIPKELSIPDELRLSKLEAMIERWHKNGILEVYIGPSTPFTCTPDFLKQLQQLACKYGVKIQTHVSETAWEVRQSIDETGMTPLEYLDSIGFLEQPLIAVHCVHLTPKEIQLCKEKHVTVVYNPKSNAKLGSGIAPIAELIEAGVDVCMATDGAASNDLLDMFEEMRFGCMLQKLKYDDPGRFTARDIYKIATQNGAEAIGLDAGVIQEGKLADIMMLDLSKASVAPVHGIIENIVYCSKAADVEAVIIDGKVVMEKGKILTVDEAAVTKQSVLLGSQRFAEISTGSLSSEF